MLKSWAWKYQGHDVRAEIWVRLSGWRRERVYVDHDLCAQWRGWSVRGPGLRCSIKNDSGGEDQLEVRFRRPIWVRSPVFQMAAGILRCQVLVNGVPWQWEPGQVHVEKRWINGESDDGFPGGSLEGPWGCLVFAVVFLFAAVSFPFLVFMGGLVEFFKELRLKSRLRRRERVVNWTDLKGKISAGPSTLIIETPFLGNVHFWWTEEDVLARSPFPPTNRWDFRFPQGRRNENPFPEWCYVHYLSEDTGKAFFVLGPTDEIRKVFLGGVDRPQKSSPAWKTVYPQLQVVVTGFGPYSKKTISIFVGILGQGGHDSVPRMAALLQGKDRHLRRLAMNALRMMGPSAQEAMPALMEQFYHGPVRERFDVADALAAIGPSAIEPLQEASKHDDPWVRCPANGALAKFKVPSGSPQSLIRQFDKRLLTRGRFFYLFLENVTRENVGEVMALLSPSSFKVIKTEAQYPQPGMEIAGSLQAREGLKAVREYLAGKK